MDYGYHESVNSKSFPNKVTQVFVKNPRSLSITARTQSEVTRLRAILPVLTFAHASYLVNLASGRSQDLDSLYAEARECSRLGIKYLVVHPGSGPKEALEKALKIFESVWPEDVRLLLETMPGAGQQLGATPESFDFHKQFHFLGYCLDTAHTWAAGHPNPLDACPERPELIHLNDSMRDFGTRKDRHEELGKGCIPLDYFRLVVDLLVPMVLETPASPGSRERELRVLHSLA